MNAIYIIILQSTNRRKKVCLSTSVSFFWFEKYVHSRHSHFHCFCFAKSFFYCQKSYERKLYHIFPPQIKYYLYYSFCTLCMRISMYVMNICMFSQHSILYFQVLASRTSRQIFIYMYVCIRCLCIRQSHAINKMNLFQLRQSIRVLCKIYTHNIHYFKLALLHVSYLIL